MGIYSFFPKDILVHSMRQDFTGLYQIATKWESMRLAFTNKGEGHLSRPKIMDAVNLSTCQEVVQ